MRTGIELIAEERQRQIDKEGFNSEHDSHNNMGELVLAASCYLGYEYPHWAETVDLIPVPKHFPWDKKWWKPTPNDRVRELAKAGALIAAEIDRLKNLTPKDKNV